MRAMPFGFLFSRARAPAPVERALQLDLPGGAVSCALRLSPRRRTLALRVDESGAVVVNAPAGVRQAELEAFLARHAGWIAEHRARALARAPVWRTGMALPWLGGDLRLRVEEGEAMPRAAGRGVRRHGDDLVCAAGADLPARVAAWYRAQARPLLAGRLAAHAARVGLDAPPLRLSGARTRWGSLSAAGVVSLNWRLAKATPDEIDYVICHELAHFRQRDHSPAFWREVERLYPDWRAARRGLRVNGRRYFEF